MDIQEREVQRPTGLGKSLVQSPPVSPRSSPCSLRYGERYQGAQGRRLVLHFSTTTKQENNRAARTKPKLAGF